MSVRAADPHRDTHTQRHRAPGPAVPSTHPGAGQVPRLCPRPVPQYSSPTYTSMFRAWLTIPTDTISVPGRHCSRSSQGSSPPARRSASTASLLPGGRDTRCPGAQPGPARPSPAQPSAPLAARRPHPGSPSPAPRRRHSARARPPGGAQGQEQRADTQRGSRPPSSSSSSAAAQPLDMAEPRAAPGGDSGPGRRHRASLSGTAARTRLRRAGAPRVRAGQRREAPEGTPGAAEGVAEGEPRAGVNSCGKHL